MEVPPPLQGFEAILYYFGVCIRRALPAAEAGMEFSEWIAVEDGFVPAAPASTICCATPAMAASMSCWSGPATGWPRPTATPGLRSSACCITDRQHIVLSSVSLPRRIAGGALVKLEVIFHVQLYNSLVRRPSFLIHNPKVADGTARAHVQHYGLTRVIDKVTKGQLVAAAELRQRVI